MLSRERVSRHGNTGGIMQPTLTSGGLGSGLRAIFSFGIRQKVVLVLLSVLALALGLNGWIALQRQKANVISETNERGATIARMMSTSLAYSVLGYDYHAIQILLDEATKSDLIVYAKVENTNGAVMAESGTKPGNVKSVLTVEESIDFEGVEVGRLVIGFGIDKVIQELERERDRQMMREGVIILIVAIGEFIALSFIILRPVSHITRSFRESVNEKGEIVGHIELRSKDEFGELARQFNGLRDELNDANRRLQSKIDHADKALLKANQQLLKQAFELKLKNEELQALSVTDPLTGLYNRRQFETIMEAEMNLYYRYCHSLSLLVLDIDHFKRVNDTYGHAVGDVVIKDVATICKETIRKTDVLCRIGGEEFVLLCKNCDKESVKVVAEKLREGVSRHLFEQDDVHIRATISIGGATLDGECSDLNSDEFFKLADQALYYSKEHGRNRVTHFSDVADELTRGRTGGQSGSNAGNPGSA